MSASGDFEFMYPATWHAFGSDMVTVYDRMIGPTYPAVYKKIEFVPERDKQYSEWNRDMDEDMKSYALRFAQYNQGPGELVNTQEGYLTGVHSQFYQVTTKTIDTNPAWGCEGEPCPDAPQKNVEYLMVTTYIPQGDSVFTIRASIHGGADSNPKIDAREEQEFIEAYQTIVSTFKLLKIGA